MDSMFKHVWLDFNDAEVRTFVLCDWPCCVVNSALDYCPVDAFTGSVEA